jgi:5-hydroxyisourate hydrolase
VTDPDESARASLRIHVLDSARGAVAEGLLVEVLRLGQDAEKRFSGRLGADGRPVDPDRRASRLEPGEYEVVFHLGDYYRARGVDGLGPSVLQSVTLRLGIADAQLAYDLPLRISPSGIRMPGA